ncbi:MAG TPA: ABC transporter permease [Chitinispirillaceae bacterium]|nr:ABC transporter permease [Chitinispirillaceae bacterium]
MINLIKVLMRSVIVGFKMALIEMRTHLLRSILSITGVMLGVASLMIMLTLIGGIDVFLNEKMVKWVGSVWIWKKAEPTQEEKITWSRSRGLRLSDADYLKKNSKLVKDVPLVITRHIAIPFKNETMLCVVRGLNMQSLALDTEDIYIAKGRFIDKVDLERGSRNCIISEEVAQKVVQKYSLQSIETVVGKTLTVRNAQLTIIGYYKFKDENHQPWQLKKGITIPLQTMIDRISGADPDPGVVMVQLNSAHDVKANASRVASTLIEKHRGVEDFEYRTAEWLDQITSMLNNVSLLMGIISLLSLTAGGLSIMNVMLSSISERIREIGTRKALGADNYQVFVQFITETVTLSIAGGTLGVIMGSTPLLFKDAIYRSTDGVIEPTILLSHLFFIVTLIVSIGVLFGLYPAIKACRMNPVEALRYE